MKSTFKKALAAVSAAAVVATSAAVFTAVPAEAVNMPSIGQVTVTLDELKANNYQVVVPISVYGGDGWDSLGFGLEWSVDELTCVKSASGQGIFDAMAEGVQVNGSGFQLNPTGIGGWVGYATTPNGNDPAYVTSENPFLNITFKVTEDAQPGDIFYINGRETSFDGAYTSSITHGTEVVTGAPSQGYIQIEGVQTTTTEATTTTTTTTTTKATTTTTTTTKATTTTTTTTAKPTTTTTTTTSTAKPTTTTTTATTTEVSGTSDTKDTGNTSDTKATGGTGVTKTTTTKAAQVTTKKNTGSTSSPKTGSMIPVAGAVAAIAVIGGVALVSKKRK